jgi:outer membrane protein assembly factor BamB
VAEPGPWGTYRGNARRTASTDGKAGPAAPKVLWAMKSRDHFVAAPVPHGDRLFVSGLGFINVSTLYALDLSPKAAERVAWKKSSPYLKQPTVSSPGVAGGKLVFGDGMHQTDGATLYCLTIDKGVPRWQLPVPGNLVHLEGSPTVAGSRAYVGGGAAGVLCVDTDRVTLDGKEMSVAAVAKVIEAKAAEVRKKYEEALKKKDPFAVPPTDDDLPRPAPVLLWQQGKGKWHVDAPVALAGERLLVASAFLDKERVGERALFCLDAKTGKQLWKAPLAINPWGGPAVSGNLVVVSGSTIGYDPKAVKGAKGVVAAFDLASGAEKWRKEVPGGVPACVALTKDVALATATDGRVRAYDLTTGRLRWFYNGGAPFFAPVALAGDTAYAGDLKGVVHALNVKSGVARWKLDLGSDPAVMAPGMIYAGPVLHGGRLYVATCNLAGENVNRPTAVVCIGEK